jgi:ubiquinone/menaquinone biosynthesis C-methylase UbiE
VRLPFTLPPVEKGGPLPVWTGRGFRIGETRPLVLRYSDNTSGWTDDLTCFHDNVTGSNHWIDRASRQYAAEQLKKYLPQTKNRVILEIGCSSGDMLRLMRRKFPDAVIIGSDCIGGSLDDLAEEFPDTPMMQFDLLKCPLPDSSIDAVVLLNVLEHIRDDALALRQIKRILKLEGIMVLEVPVGPGLYDVYDKMLMHYRRYSPARLNELVHNVGFRIARRSHLGFFIFPAFWLVKKWNRRLLYRHGIELQNVVKRNITKTKNNRILEFLMDREVTLQKIFRYPVGIRCVMTCVKSE